MFTWHTRSDRIRSDKPSEGRGRKGKGDDQAGCLSQGKEKCVFSGTTGVILFPPSIRQRSSLHPFQSAFKGGMKSMNAGKLYSGVAGGRPRIGCITWNGYCFMS